MKKLIAFILGAVLLLFSLQSFSQSVTDYRLEDLSTTDTYLRNSLPNNSFGSQQNLITGGWGDFYGTLIKFNIDTLPSLGSDGSASVWLFNKAPPPAPQPSQPTQITMYMLDSDFTNSTTFSSFGWSVYTWGTFVKTINVSPYGYWTEFDITNYYNFWKMGLVPNRGLLLYPNSTNNNFNFFQSSSTAASVGEKPILRITKANTTQFLSFPIGTNLYPQGAYTPGKITSVLDHNMDKAYTPTDGKILTFTGEVFEANTNYPQSTLGCYPKSGNTTWSTLLQSLYKGTGLLTGGQTNCLPGKAINYENHPGYDYSAIIGTPVKAAAAGVVVNNTTLTTGQNNKLCVPKGLNGVSFKGCAAWGAVGIDHGNGYITQYLHLSSITVTAGQTVTEGQQIGLSGDKGVSGSPHLHFEVLKLRSVAGYTNDYQPGSYATVDPYGFDGSSGVTDYLANITGVPNVKLWK